MYHVKSRGKDLLKLIFIAFITIIASTSLNAQNYLRGIIYDEDQNPIPFATVKFKKDSTSPVLFYGLSDKNGRYALTLTGVKSGFLEISSVGYIEQFLPVNILEVDTMFIDINLTRNRRVLQEVVINNVPSIVVSGDTTSYSAESFKKGNESSLGDLLDNVPGFRTLPGGLVTYNGRIIDRILINGDDLTGSGYQRLTKYLDINGIEQLQVIQNFLSDENILRDFLSGQEQVLNIKYKSGFLSKIFGTIDGAGGVPFKHYNGGFQALRIVDKTKILAIARNNSIGHLNYDQGNTDISEQIAAKAEYEIELPERNFLSGVENLRTGIPDLSAVFRNNSAYGTLNLFSRPGSRLSIRGQFSYAFDDLRQLGTSHIKYISEPNFGIRQENNLSNKMRKISGLVSVNYYPDDKRQLRVTLKALGSKRNSFSGTALSNGLFYDELVNGENSSFGARFFYNQIISKNLAFTFDGEYLFGKQPNAYHVSPPILLDFFGFSSGFTDINQIELQRFRICNLNTKLLSKFGRHSLQFSAYYRRHFDEVQNNILARSIQSIAHVSDDSINNTRSTRVSTGMIIQDSWEPIAGFSVSAGINLAFAENSILDQFTPVRSKAYSELKLIPSASIGWQISRENRINISYTGSPQFSETRVLGRGYVIRNATSFYENVDTAQFDANSNISLLYSFQSPLRKREMLFVNLTCFNSPSFLLTEVGPFNQIAFVRYTPTQKRTKFLNFIITYLKFSKSYRTQIIPTMRISRGSRYNIVQGTEQLVTFDQLQTSVAVNQQLGRLQVKSNFKYSLQWQYFGSGFKSSQFATTMALNYKVGPKMFSEIGVNYYGIDSDEQNFNDYLATSGRILYKPGKDNLEISLSISNIFNNKRFNSVIVSDTNQQTSEYQIFPRFILLGIKFKF